MPLQSRAYRFDPPDLFDRGEGDEAEEDGSSPSPPSLADLLQDAADALLLPLLRCCAASGDGLSVAGVALGQSLTLLWRATDKNDEGTTAELARRELRLIAAGGGDSNNDG